MIYIKRSNTVHFILHTLLSFLLAVAVEEPNCRVVTVDTYVLQSRVGDECDLFQFCLPLAVQPGD